MAKKNKTHKKTKEIKEAKKNVERISIGEISETMLFETAWEVCNQVGGIYTVIRSKIPSVIEKWSYNNYCLLGPYFYDQVSAVVEPIEDYSDPIGQAVKIMQDNGFDVYYGNWLVSGKPRVVLFDPFKAYDRLADFQFKLWENHHISTDASDDLMNQVISFGYQVTEFFRIFSGKEIWDQAIIAHFHEWMAGIPIPEIRKHNYPVKTVFTTHATMLGRYLAMNEDSFYDHLPFFNWADEAKKFNIESKVAIERAAAHGSHIFTTVSDVTAEECKYLLGREPDKILPNGLNITRFEVLHEFQNLHLKYKEMIHEFVMGHFFPSYSFDLDKTLYFFTSGRFEYKNKGFDVTLEALARLNWKLKEAGTDITVVTFFITRQPFHSINADALHSRALMQEIRSTCDSIENQVGKSLFYKITANNDGKIPNLNELIEEYLRLRLRRTLLSWKSNSLPSVVTHNLVNDGTDQILNYLRMSNLVNKEDDRVKIIYHPDFIAPSNPLFRMEYGQFVRGCHLGVFPSYYEPWGYTPLECIASGLPTVTSDLAGFGDYVIKTIEDKEAKGIYVVDRKWHNFDEAANQLADLLFDFATQSRRERVAQRNRVESSSIDFDWKNLSKYYDQAYKNLL